MGNLIDNPSGGGGASIGGAITSGTPGSVIFVGGTTASPTFAQDNQNFYFDDTNDKVSVRHTLGSEKVTNGNFASGTSWTTTTGWSISGGVATHGSNGTGTLSQNISAVIGEEYIASFDVSSLTVSSVTFSCGGVTQSAITANGTYTYRFTATSTAVLAFTPTNTSRFSIDNVSVKRLSGGMICTGELDLWANNSNSSPGTTRHILLDNAGAYTYIENRFNGTTKSTIGFDSSGSINNYSTGGNYSAWYSGISSPSLYMYSYPSAIVHYGNGIFGGNVSAGSVNTPTSTLQSAGGLALKVKKITSSQAIDNTATHWLCDASSATCTGAPTYACTHWTNQTDCELNDSHGGCSWFAGYSCSSFNGDQTSCESQTGCSYETADCSGVGAYDQYSCESYSGCSWTNSGGDCSGFDESTCNSTSGCTANRDYCYNYSDGGGDGTACSSVSGHGCNYDSGSGSCSDGMGDSGWFSGCSGTYDNYACAGTYYTGNCNGTYGAGCSGTSTCSGINDSTSCGAEGGCTWMTAINVTLPQISSYPDRTYWLYNDSSTNADVNILPYSGDTVDYGSSLVLSSFKDGVHLSPLRILTSCAGFSEGSCTPSGCSPSYSNCTYDSMSGNCTGDSGSVCSAHNGDQGGCESQTYFTICSGSYVSSSNWYVWSRT